MPGITAKLRVSSTILDNGSQSSLDGSPRNLHMSLTWGQD